MIEREIIVDLTENSNYLRKKEAVINHFLLLEQGPYKAKTLFLVD